MPADYAVFSTNFFWLVTVLQLAGIPVK